MLVLPKKQFNHRYIDSKIQPWLDLHFPADSAFNGRVILAYRRKDSTGIYDLNRCDIGEVSRFVENMHVSANMDYYITANSVSGVRRVTEDVFGLHNIVIDIDCHEEALSPALLAGFIWRCSRDLWNTGDCPEPNSIVFSGRGVQLWWAIEPASVKIQYWYKRMQSYLLDALQGVLDESPEELGALSIDRSASVRLAGLFRLPFTYNTKTGRKNSVHIRNHNRYELRKMLDRYVPAEYNPHKSQSKRRWAAAEESSDAPEQEYVPLAESDAQVLKGGTSAMARRVQQLVRLRALRNAPMGQEMRDRFCFTVYCALLADYEQEEAWARLLAFNEGFKEPLHYPALQQMMSSASEKKYRLTNAWIIDELVITEKEQQSIGLTPASEERSERMSRNYTRDLIRKSLREDRDNKILSLFSAGMSKSAIARELGLSWNTVAKVIAMAEDQITAQEPEMAVEEPMAAGAEYQSAPVTMQKTDSSKSVRNNIVFYGEAIPTKARLSIGGGQAVRNKGEPPDK